MKGGILWFCMAGAMCGQTPNTPLTFEVASVKPSTEVHGMFVRYLPGGGLRVSEANLKNLIALAYGVREFLVLGGPSWVDTGRFDIDARAETSDDTRYCPTRATGPASGIAERSGRSIHYRSRGKAVGQLSAGALRF